MYNNYNTDDVINEIYEETMKKMQKEKEDMEILDCLFRIHEFVIERRNNDDYVENKVQMDKLLEIYEFFKKYAEEFDGYVEPLELIPKEESCGVTAHFQDF